MALIKTVDEVREQVRLSAEVNPDFFPKWDQVEEKYLLPLIGMALYNELVTAYNNGTLSTEHAALLKKCQAVIVPYGFIDDLPHMQTLITDNGLIAEAPAETRKPFKWEYNNAIAALYSKAYAAQETLIVYLIKHTDDFPSWTDSDYNASGNFTFIRNGKDLESVQSLMQPHRCYMLMRGLFNSYCVDFLTQAISEELYNAMSDRIKNDTLSAEEKRILPKLRAASARKALEYAARELNMSFSQYGFTIVDNTRNEQGDGSATANSNQVNGFIGHMQESSEKLLSEAVQYINEKASSTVFPEYYASSLYKDPNNYKKTPNNRNRRGTFGL